MLSCYAHVKPTADPFDRVLVAQATVEGITLLTVDSLFAHFAQEREPRFRNTFTRTPLHKKYKIYLDHVSVAHVPEDYEGRQKEIFPGAFKHLRLLALDPYDLSKLESNIQGDRDDVRHLARTVPRDLEDFKDRYQKELRWQLGNPEREGA